MFRTRTLAILAVTALAFGFAIPAGAEDDGCVRLDMEVVCTGGGCDVRATGRAARRPVGSWLSWPASWQAPA